MSGELDPLLPAAGNAASDDNGCGVDKLLIKMWDCSLGSVVNLILLRRNAEELAEEIEKLIELRDDLLNNRLQPAYQLRITGQLEIQLSRWMNMVNGAAGDFSSFQRMSFEDRCLSFSGFSPSSTASELLTRVRRLASEGNRLFLDQLQSLQLEAVSLVPSDASSSSMVGARKRLQEIERYIQDDSVAVIGIYGMGGVGKTALLKIIHNEFLMEETFRPKFDVAIWVTVSQEAKDIPSIQKSIADRLRLSSSATAKDIFRELGERRFILFLDDIWETPDLEEIGIPDPNSLNRTCKILFTTRSKELCGRMDADVLVKVDPLDTNSSWELFRSRFGRSPLVLDDDAVIRSLEKQVVARCGGLPISLITMGRVMAQAKTTDDWRDAISKLHQNCAAEISEGMQKHVFETLKRSFDMLKSKTLRDCFLYLALFPENSYVEKEEIVDYWICEGFLDSDDFDEVDIEDARQRGRNLITELQNICLVEAHGQGWYNDEWLRQPVRLHNIIRDVAMWITRHEFVVLSGSNYNNNHECIVSHVPELGAWQKARRISLINNRQIEEPPSSCWTPCCPNLTTLLLRGSKLAKNIPCHQDFFACARMAALKVLDLTNAGLSELPIGITSLTSLRHLSLKKNNLTSLPKELGNLTNLKILILSYNDNLRSIPREALVPLSSLQVLDMRVFYDSQLTKKSHVEDLARLNSLCELHLRHACSWASLQVIAESPVLRRCIRKLIVWKTSKDATPIPTGDTISQQIYKLSKLITRLELGKQNHYRVMGELKLCSDRLQHLEDLRITYFVEANISIIPCTRPPSALAVTTLFPRLKQLSIVECGCSELAWIGKLPCLQRLNLERCEKLTTILPGESGSDGGTPFFPELKYMRLWSLPLLSINIHTQFLTALEQLTVHACPKLRLRLLVNAISWNTSTKKRSVSLWEPIREKYRLKSWTSLWDLVRRKLIPPKLRALWDLVTVIVRQNAQRTESNLEVR